MTLTLKIILAIFTQNSKKYGLSAITCDGFELESPNVHQIYILGFSSLLLNAVIVDLDLQGHMAIWSQDSKKWHSSSLLYTNLGWPRGITKPSVLLLTLKT